MEYDLSGKLLISESASVKGKDRKTPQQMVVIDISEQLKSCCGGWF